MTEFMGFELLENEKFVFFCPGLFSRYIKNMTLCEPADHSFYLHSGYNMQDNVWDKDIFAQRGIHGRFHNLNNIHHCPHLSLYCSLFCDGWPMSCIDNAAYAIMTARE